MALNEVLEEIKEGVRQKREESHGESQGVAQSQKKPKAEKKPMTKAEIEAYKQKMMEREEAKYLAKTGLRAKADATKKARKATKRAKQERKAVRVEKKATVEPKPRGAPRTPKMLQPLEPLYLLKIPGLPRGDLIAVCIVHGADA